MSNIYTCLAKIIGLKLEPNKLMKFGDYIITNSPEIIFGNFIEDQHDFIIKFGSIVFDQIVAGRVF